MMPAPNSKPTRKRNMMSIKQALRSELRAWKRRQKARNKGLPASAEYLAFVKASNRLNDVRERYAIEGKKGWM